VLAPHDPEHGEFEVVRLPLEDFGDAGSLVVGQPEGAVFHGGKLLADFDGRPRVSSPFSNNYRLFIYGLHRNTVDMPSTKKNAKTSMSEEHKAALALGREQGRAVRHYLEAMELHRPKRGRKRTPDSIEKQLAGIRSKIETADPLLRVNLIQQRMDLERELTTKSVPVDLDALEQGFVRAAREYGHRRGISYAAWREAGIDAAVLKKAGIARSEPSPPRGTTAKAPTRRPNRRAGRTPVPDGA